MIEIEKVLKFIEDAVDSFSCFQYFYSCSECPLCDLEHKKLQCGFAVTEYLREQMKTNETEFKMKLTEEEKKICAEYSKRIDGKVRCHQCPLNVGNPNAHDFRCKACCHWDEKEKDWVYD